MTVPMVGVAVAYFMLFFLPGSKAIDELKKQTAEKQAYVEQAGELATALGLAQAELDKARSYYQAWKDNAPRQRELAALFGKINQLAKVAGTTTTRFDPEPLVQRDHLREIPLTMGCSGTNAQIFEFLRGLESLPLSIWVTSVQIEKVNPRTKAVDCEAAVVVFTGNPGDSDYANNSD